MILIQELDYLEREQLRLDKNYPERGCSTCLNRHDPACSGEVGYSEGFGCDSYDEDDSY